MVNFPLPQKKIAFLTCMIALMLFGLARLIPPMQSPDENFHLVRADMISHGQLLLQPNADESRREGGFADINFIRFTEAMLQLSGTEGNKNFSSQLWEREGTAKWAHDSAFYNAAGTGYYLPIIYLPHALGLFTSRKLDLTIRASYELTRTMVVATTVLLIMLALSVYTPNVLTLMLVTTPMTLFQLSSPTIDGLCAAMAILIIGLWLSVSTSDQFLASTKITFKEWSLYILIIVLCTARTNLLPVLLIPLTLVITRPHGYRIAAVTLVCALTFSWIAFAAATTYDSRVVRAYSTSSIFFSYLSNPEEFYQLLTNTLGDNESRRFYRDSYFGILGWLDTPIPHQAIRVLYATAVISAVVLAIITPWRRVAAQRALLIFMGLASAFFIFLALSITWTNYPAEKIRGIQGRYFLIPTLLLAGALGKVDIGSIKLNRIEISVIFAFLGYSLYVLATTLAAQYKLVNLSLLILR